MVMKYFTIFLIVSLFFLYKQTEHSISTNAGLLTSLIVIPFMHTNKFVLITPVSGYNAEFNIILGNTLKQEQGDIFFCMSHSNKTVW